MLEDYRMIYKIVSILQKSMDYEVLDIRRLSADYLGSFQRVRKVLSWKLDELGVTEYNVNEISKYATRKYMFGRFDEVEAEYYALIKRGWYRWFGWSIHLK